MLSKDYTKGKNGVMSFDAHRIIAEAMNLLSNMGEFEDEFMDC